MASSTADIGTKIKASETASKRLPWNTLAFSIFVAYALGYGWMNRESNYLSAETGLGYALGILGGVFMLALLLYPLRKRLRLLKHLGPVSRWFRSHMLLGILGPVCILFHCNFSLGSTNSNVALFCMLIVAGSGIIGRYIYTRIHYGLYGDKANLQDLNRKLSDSQSGLDYIVKIAPAIRENLIAANPDQIRNHRMKWYIAILPGSPLYLINALRFRFQLRRALKIAAKRQAWTHEEVSRNHANALAHAQNYFTLCKKIVGLIVYERLFSLWHVLHLPLFIMLILSGITHVIAVHLY